jgi:hypothetical protein
MGGAARGPVSEGTGVEGTGVEGTGVGLRKFGKWVLPSALTS